MGNSGIWTEDATVREIPKARLAAMGWMVLVLVTVGMVAWELQMRSLGLVAADLDDGPSHWAVERRKVDTGDHDDVVIFGSSRFLFDTDLDVWEQVTGRRPIQLALPGTNPRPFLVRFAEESDFSRLVVVDVTPELYFSALVSALPEFRNVQDFWLEESPSQRFGQQVGLFLSRHLAFLEDQYALMRLIDQLEFPNRGGVIGPDLRVWKLSETYDDRQTNLWRQIETNERLRSHAIRVWLFGSARRRPPPREDEIAKICAEARDAVTKIRARGGDLAFVRFPSTGAYYEREQFRTPRDKTWDRLLRETGSFGVHFDDYPEMQGFELPELSHLSRESATRFTRAYVELLVRKLPWLRREQPPEAGA